MAAKKTAAKKTAAKKAAPAKNAPVEKSDAPAPADKAEGKAPEPPVVDAAAAAQPEGTGNAEGAPPAPEAADKKDEESQDKTSDAPVLPPVEPPAEDPLAAEEAARAAEKPAVVDAKQEARHAIKDGAIGVTLATLREHFDEDLSNSYLEPVIEAMEAGVMVVIYEDPATRGNVLCIDPSFSYGDRQHVLSVAAARGSALRCLINQVLERSNLIERVK